MFRSLFPFRRLLASTFLVVFVNVLAGQCWCATLKVPRATNAALAQQAPKKPAHAGCHGHGATAKKDQSSTAQNKTSHQHSSKKGGPDDCCRDKTASLLSSLTTPAEKHLLSPAPALLPAATEFQFRPQAGKWNRTATVALVPPRHLKPKIPDIRIFIQSLTV
ncbi:hypothetical protein [Hymenobacter arizonensis]|uniref:Uncharacterized protein n=1 Tax=Hymenobacter arizonensis TaxID=1227077 RepID=A0A1I6AHU0_HYMAR|nr:hypothetical protein [Hymenobacter arizonensis]SFQ68087.1 hypothetical protein SAMN04515668_3682 [Hymenobacter arizonensis]